MTAVSFDCNFTSGNTDKMSDAPVGRWPRVAILGGCGFIGRNLVEHFINNNLADKVYVVDKVPPEIAWLNKNHAEIFKNPNVEYRSANLINPVSCHNAFQIDGGWDLVVNCAGETKPGQTDAIYREGILALSLNCIKESINCKAKKYVEISSGAMYSSSKEAHKENGPMDPWDPIAKWKSQVENELQKYSSELDYTIVRPATVYGIGARRGITARLMMAAIYKQLRETMKPMWTADLKINTVHVLDLCRAIAFLAGRNESKGQIYNIVDKGDSTQGKITDITASIFNVKHDYWGKAFSTLAKADLSSLIDEANDKHLSCWGEMCSADGISNTPLDPTMHTENLLKKHVYLDGSKLEKLGFKFEHEAITEHKFREVVDDLIEMKIFPRNS